MPIRGTAQLWMLCSCFHSGDLTLVKQNEGLQLSKGGVESAYFGGGESNITARQMLERWKDEIKRSKYYISIFF